LHLGPFLEWIVDVRFTFAMAAVVANERQPEVAAVLVREQAYYCSPPCSSVVFS
jgi:hypothetical protein